MQKLKHEHIHLSSFSKMRVDLAAQVIVRLQCTDLLTIILQVLSEKVGIALASGPDEHSETAKLNFVKMFDKYVVILLCF